MRQVRRAARRIGASFLTLLALIAGTLGLFLLPPVVHLLLDLADAAENLNVAPSVAYALSDELVRDLLVGGTFGVPLGAEPLLSDSERSHLADVGVLFRVLMVAGAISLAALTTLFIRKRRWFYQALHDGALLLGTGAVLVGGAFAFAFDATFTFAHELLFPGGNWTFNPATDRLVQLYPMNFWLLAAIIFCVVLVGAAVLGISLARSRRR